VPPKNLICLVVDGVHAGMVGAYGNSWIHTEQLDRLASESYVFDQAVTESPNLATIYEALWQGCSLTDGQRPNGASLASIAGKHGWRTALVSDEPRIATFSGAADFHEAVRCEQPHCDAAADDPSATGSARLFDLAMDRLNSAREPFLLWVHSRGLYGPWDAPYECRRRFAQEDDPPPPLFVDPPDRWLPLGYDPDELLGIAHAYAGQIAIVDRCIETLFERLETSKLLDSTLVSFVSPRGFPLGEHRRVGLCDQSLYSELTQMVWLLRFPSGLGRLDRSQALVTAADLPGTLLHWMELDVNALQPAAKTLLPVISGDASGTRDRVYLQSRNDRALRTAAWLLAAPAEGPAELYAKPSDRWEVNDVANLCPDIVAGMQDAMRQHVEPGQGNAPAPLAPALTTELD
jgi:arylsulfatase A-like enzyme